MTCSFASSGCDYPAGECLGICGSSQNIECPGRGGISCRRSNNLTPDADGVMKCADHNTRRIADRELFQHSEDQQIRDAVAHCIKHGGILLTQYIASGQVSAAQVVAHEAAGDLPVQMLCKESMQPVPPHECKTEAEKKAFAFGWWKALESVRGAS